MSPINQILSAIGSARSVNEASAILRRMSDPFDDWHASLLSSDERKRVASTYKQRVGLIQETNESMGGHTDADSYRTMLAGLVSFEATEGTKIVGRKVQGKRGTKVVGDSNRLMSTPPPYLQILTVLPPS